MSAEDSKAQSRAAAEWASQGLASLLDRANAPIFALDLDGLVTEWNDKTSELTGHTKDAMRGKPLAEQADESSQKVLQDCVAASAKGEMAPPIALQIKKAGGGVVSLHVGLSPQFASDGQAIGAVCVGQVVAEAVLQQSPDPAKGEAVDFAAKQKTMGMVMHELRSPLHGVIGLASTLSQDESPLQKPLQMICSSAERVQELVTNLMDYWNLSEYPATELVLDAIDLSTLITESLARCELAKDKRGKPIKKAKVTVTKELDKDVPTIMGDQQAVSQMIYHLIINALKFTHQGDVKIFVQYSKAANSVEINVQDTGIGIGKDSLTRIFEPFQQEDASESRKYEGIGLGLAIVREVLRIHGGSVGTHSTQGEGTTFTVTLPQKPPPRAAAPQAPAPQAPATAPRAKWPVPGQDSQGKGQAVPVVAALPPLPSSAPRVIMSVDDDHVNQEVMRSVLEPCGFSLVICMSGTECLEYMEKEDFVMPDLILLDLMMPGINGFDVVAEQRKKYTLEQLPIIMVSAKNQASSVVKGMELGCNDWIHKPFDRQELIARVKSHLRGRDTMLQLCCLLAAQQRHPEAAPELVPEPPPKPTLGFVRIDSAIDTSVLFVGIVDQAGGNVDGSLSRLFEVFEVLSAKLASRTEIVGSCYLAMAMSSDTDLHHADKMLQLALSMEDAIIQQNRENHPSPPLWYRLGIHTDSHVPTVIDSSQGKCPKQYPNTSFFGSTVRGAMRLVESRAGGGIFLSRSTRGRLSPGIENEMRDRGLQMLSRSSSKGAGADGDDCYCLVKDGAGRSADDLGRFNESEAATTAQYVQRLQEELHRLHQELHSSRGIVNVTHQRLINSDKVLEHWQGEVGSLHMQMEMRAQMDQKGSSQPNGNVQQAPSVSLGSLPPAALLGQGTVEATVPAATASVLFLQWQNAHMQAELRYYQEALAAAKGQLQLQAMRSRAAERQQGALQDHVEHLELDVLFKAACGGLLGPPQGSGGGSGGRALGGGSGLPNGDSGLPKGSASSNSHCIQPKAIGLSLLGAVTGPREAVSKAKPSTPKAREAALLAGCA